MSEGGPRLALMARLSEALRWDEVVKRHESDPWAHLRRKLLAVEPPLRQYKEDLYRAAKENLLRDLERPLMPPGALEAHREAFEALLPVGDFADLSFHLEPGADRASRLEGARAVLSAARAPTLFDHEALPPERRSRAWEKRVAEMSARLDLDTLTKILERGPEDAARRARVARRLRRNLGEYLAVSRGETALRDEITPFMLSRLEAAVAASLRLAGRWR